ncbi:Rieske 2Fe-2S domain-containing protein, partial [Stutzerimonas stutzeri]
GVITRGDEQIAVWRDDAGTLHAVSAACTHMGCSVTWNNADRTWDCPCHGSIFQADGEVIHGPAIEPLAARSL